MLQRNECTSTIHECKSIRDILNYTTYESMTFLDLDNTVMEPDGDLGSDQEFVSMMNYACQLIPDNKEAANLVLCIYHAVQHHVSMKTVEAEVALIIQFLQNNHIPLFALTARGTPIIEPTIKQLKNIGIDFSKQWGEIGFTFTVDDQVIIFQNGILFCNGVDKGKCIKAFFEVLKHHPSHVVMVDDKEKYLMSVKKVIEAMGGRFDGLYYTFLQEKVDSYNKEKSVIQLNNLYKKLPNNVKHAVDKLKIVSSHPNSLFSKTTELTSTQLPSVSTPLIPGLSSTPTSGSK